MTIKSLCIDVGNTRTKLAVFDDGTEPVELIRVEAISEAILDQIISKFNIKQVIISVVGNEIHQAEEFLKSKVDVVIRLSHETPLPVQNKYQTPHTLGKDRIAAVVGAAHLYPNTNCLVVDAGTCITYDFVTASGDYLGGSILPGIDMRFKALHQFTARLPQIDRQNLDSFIGHSTQTSIQTGVQWGVLHELEGFAQQYRAKFGALKVIVTGGDTEFFETHGKMQIFAHPNLVLTGLHQILIYNV